MSEYMTIQRTVYALADESGHERLDTVTTERPDVSESEKVISGVEVRTIEITGRGADGVSVVTVDGREYSDSYTALMSESAGLTYAFNS